MAYFKISQPNQPTKWIKSIDRANGTLEFSEDRNGCFQQDSGFFADSEFAYLKFHFTEEYPELEFMTIDTDYGYHSAAVMEQDAPNDPMGEAEADGPDMPWQEPQELLNQVAQPQVAEGLWIDAEANEEPW